MTIRFYKPFTHKIQVLSFDLDDTLYANETVIQDAEQAQFDAVCERVPAAKEQGIQYWLELKWRIAKLQPELCHDVTHWRRTVIYEGLKALNVLEPNLGTWTEEIFRQFYWARSDFSVPAKTFSVLNTLKDKYKLIAVTNGNADIDRLKLRPYFVKYYRAGEQNTRMKPFPDMLHLASQQLGIEAQHILHIGDNVGSDIKSAQKAGCPNLWYNPNNSPYKGAALPNAEYSDLDDLLHLL